MVLESVAFRSLSCVVTTMLVVLSIVPVGIVFDGDAVLISLSELFDTS